MSDELPDSLIPYDEIVQEALRAVVGRVLGEVQQSGGLPGTHHFYITFKTQAAGVAVPRQLIERFPDEMTIVLQNKYWDLKVASDGFEVSLTFSQVPAHLVIPFSAITAFVDPAVNFALQFQVQEDGDTPEPPEPAGNDAPSVNTEDGSNVVTVDFGKKK
ncbi:SspB family protein [Sphingobium aquiterrae]|uniref:SspB family protein n=1 Tax=Sphingobium aquiterrae TaxID=2038656 RepID=UPI0030173332